MEFRFWSTTEIRRILKYLNKKFAKSQGNDSRLQPSTDSGIREP